jgi:AAA domain
MPVKKTNRPANKPPIDIVAVEHLPAVLAVLAWGRSGTGKTTFAATFPKPLLLLDVREKGTDSVSNVKGVKVGQITSWDEFEAVYWYLEGGQHDYKTVVIDQVTQLQNLAIAKAKKDQGKDEDDASSKRTFGVASGLMNQWLLNYRDLIDKGIHVVFLAHDRTTRGDEDDAGDDQIQPEVGPRLMPSVASLVNGAVKIIGNTYIRERFHVDLKAKIKKKIREVEYGMRIGPHAYYTTKVRSPVGIAAPDTVVDPTYEKLLAIMRGDYSETPTTVRRKQ